jgi:diguanylate cyclase (GGDEF)-like protein
MHEPGAGTACHHFKSEPIKIESGGPYACVPLAVRGEVSGLLSIRLAETQRLDEERRSAISTFGNAVALGLSTLQLRETLQEQSIRDPLTGLARSQFSHAVLAREIRRAERHRESLSLALLDLNGFSQLKEAYGPQAVDGLLHEVETLLWSTLGPFDLAARCESQQFLVILVGDDLDNHYLDNREAARPMPRLRRICLEIQQKTDTYQGVALLQVTVSAGLAEWPVHGTTAEELMRSANQALRAARLAGPGCIERYSEIGMPPAGDARGPLDGDRSPTGNLLP